MSPDDRAARCGDCGALATIFDEASPDFALCQACVDQIEADAEAWQEMRAAEGHPPCYFMTVWLPAMIGHDPVGWLVRLGPVRMHWHAPSRCLWVGLRDGWGLAMELRRW